MGRIIKNMVLYSIGKINGMEEHDMMRLVPKVKGPRGKPRLFYSNFRWQGKKVVVPLDATEYEKTKALGALGLLIADLREGVHPATVRKQIKKIVIPGEVISRNQEILDKHLYPFFGEYRYQDVDENLIRDYIEKRYGLNKDGKLQAVHNTIDKELWVLQKLLRCASKLFKLPKIEYEHIAKKGDLPALTFQQIEAAAEFMPEKYLPVYWVMVFTGLDIKDVLDLRQGQVKNGWIDRKRGKTGRPIHLPVSLELAEVFKGLPRNLDPDALIFPGLVSHRVSKGIVQGFKRAEMPGYGSKYLRRFLASIMIDNGYSVDLTAKMLGHAPGSKITDGYIKPYDETLLEAVNLIGKARSSHGQL